MTLSGDNAHNRRLFVLFNIICWTVIFLMSTLLTFPHSGVESRYALLRLTIPTSLLVMYYSNYSYLVPRLFVAKRYRAYAAVNIALALVLCVFIQVGIRVMVHHSSPMPVWRGELFYAGITLRNFLIVVMAGVVALLLKLSMMWQVAERKRREMEVEKAEAELKLLANKLQPHFLLNTLNNIYALIAIDQQKAQRSLMSLSTLLRNMLYTDESMCVDINEEVKALKSYIELMSIRQQRNVSIDTHFDVPPTDGIMVAPHIFITLVENAFKHGVSATEESHISISLRATREQIEFCTRNSNHPKSADDKSGHGIGLKQVERLLENNYKGAYEWVRQTDENNNIYISKITLYDTKMRNY